MRRRRLVDADESYDVEPDGATCAVARLRYYQYEPSDPLWVPHFLQRDDSGWPKKDPSRGVSARGDDAEVDVTHTLTRISTPSTNQASGVAQVLRP